MAKFGGWSHFGGASSFGGGEPYAQKAYRILRSPPIAPEGLWPQDDDVTINYVLRAEAKIIGHGLVQLHVLGREIFPQTAHDTLPDWETLLGLVVSPGATIADRRNAAQARSRGDMGVSLPELRAILYPIFQSVTAWYCDFDGDSIERLTHEGNGTVTVGSSLVALAITNPVDGDWLAENANRHTMRVNDVNDGWTLRGLITASTLGDDTAGGIVAMGDVDNAVMLVAGDEGGTEKLRVDTVIEGTLTVGVTNVTLPAWPVYVQISRDRATGRLTFSYGADADDLTTILIMAQPVRTLRRVGFFSRNITASANTVSVQFDELQLIHETPVNNVEIIEQTRANTLLAGDSDLIFEAYVIRRPGDAGSYDIKQAQRTCDSVKMGHTLLLAGECPGFLCDDPYSLCDRDPLGE